MNDLLGRLAILVLVSASAACDAGRKTTASKPGPSRTELAPELFRGWYLEHANTASFETCGQARRWQVDSAELQRRSRAFAETNRVEAAGPVYVVLLGAPSADGTKLIVSSVRQFGSATPVRDCGMTGVVMDDPADG